MTKSSLMQKVNVVRQGLAAVLLFLAISMGSATAGVLDNGVDAANLGKGDWIYILSTATGQHGGLDGLMAYEKSQGMDYIIVKAGDGDVIFPNGTAQFTSNVVSSAHAAGLKIFGYTRSWGTNLPGELNVITNAIKLGADGYVIDAEQEWETVPNNTTAARLLLQPIKAAFPNRFLGHSPQMYIHFHSAFPYTMFGIFCDAVMPQAYWKSFGITPTQCVTDLGTDWRNWQNGLTGTNRNAIKPIAATAQGYTPDGETDVTAAEITEFSNALKNNPNPATTGGYKSVNYFRSELHTPEIWDAMRTNSIGTNQPVAPFIYNLIATNITDVGASVNWTTDINSDSILEYGAGTSFTTAITNSALVTSHSVAITGLVQSTTYSFRVRSKAGGSTNTSYSGEFTFLTKIAGFLPDIIIDNVDATVVGSWIVGTASTDKYGASYHDRGKGTGANYLLYTPTITQGGLYQVQETHPQGGNRTTVAPHLITYYGGSQTLLVNQQTGGGVVGGKFNALGTFYFQAGTSGSVRIHDGYTDAGSVVIADAIKFVYVGQPAPPAITVNPLDRTVKAGSNVVFTVTATGTAPLSYQWQFNGTNIGGANATSYTRFNAQAADAGTYTVAVTNPGGTTSSSDAVLVVNTLPVIDEQPASQSINQGSNATFTVSASGIPTPSYQWWFAGATIGGANGSAYTRVNAQPAQAGNYWVVVFNSVGSVTSSIVSLVVNVPPAISAQPQSQNVIAGTNVTFNVTASGTAPLAYQWQFNGVDIGGATTNSYSITGVQTNHAGAYSVVITNVAGVMGSSNAVLTVTVPQPQLQFQSIGILPDQTIQMIITGDPGTHYIVEGSSNLVSWVQVANLTNNNGTVQFTDGSVTNNPMRYYRAYVGP